MNLQITLGPPWILEHAIVLGGKQPGYPTSYKVDLAWIERKLAIEVDGPSHNTHAAKAKDMKKNIKLQELGWKVWRINNSRALFLSTTYNSKEILDIMLTEC